MDDALAALRSLATDYQLREEFSDAVNCEVEELLANPGIDDPALTDLTSLPFVTIDHETSKDLDQAAYVERTGDDFVIYYALADAAYYVHQGSALFTEALERGASYYFPGFMIPMLPRELSEGLISLNPDVERRSMVFRMQVAADGECTDVKILSGRIRCRAKLSFRGVQRFLDGESDSELRSSELHSSELHSSELHSSELHSSELHSSELHSSELSPDVQESLRQLKTVGLLRMKHAKDRNVVRYRRSEVDVALDGAAGLRFVVNDSIRVPVERYNEQLSLLCNVEGAKFLLRHNRTDGIDPVYRVHPPPEPKRVEQLEKTIAGIVKTHQLDPENWLWKRGTQDLSDYLDALPEDGPLGRIASAIHRQAVVINGRSSFRTEPGIHHGVGAPVYARFSAPMREIVGIFLHKETWEVMQSNSSADPDTELRNQVVEAANRAKSTQRDVTNLSNLLVLNQLFRDDLKSAETPKRKGTVMGMQRGRVYVLLDQPPIDVKVYVRHLAEVHGSELKMDEDNLTLSGKDISVSVGSPVRVTVRGFDEKKNRWKLGLENA